ncbi:MAG: transporter [Pseudomonadota bacterium]
MKKSTLAAITATLSLSISATGAAIAGHDHHSGHVHEDLAPIGVMGAHTHESGDWMFSYRYMHMDMQGNREGTSGISDSDVLKKYAVTPTDMSMDMHMFGVMYAPTDQLTLMAMLPYLDKSMDHRTRMGVKFNTGSNGIGDLKLSGIYNAKRWGRNELLLNLGISLPTGSTDEEDSTPIGKVRLPYPMQLGSGTYDLMPGVTYNGQNDVYSWGGQTTATLRMNRNNGYRHGHRIEATGWGTKKLSDWWSISARVKGSAWGDIHGTDSRIAQTSPMGVPLVPTADPDTRGGKSIDGLLGVNFYARSGMFKGHRLAVELSKPVYQDLDGPALETNWAIIAGWQLVI